MATLLKIYGVFMLQMLSQIFYKEGLAQAPSGESNHSNITTPISVGNERVILTPAQNIFWVSPNNIFALGFLATIPSSSASSPSFTLSVFYSYLSQYHITPVWSPHRGRLLTHNASLVLTELGDLVLLDSGTQIWHTNTTKHGVASFSISDEGNILLYGINSNIIWQSWDEPITDTLLPGQTLFLGTNIVDSKGRYLLSMQTDSNFVLYFMGALSQGGFHPYWASGTYNANVTQAYYNASQGLVLVNNSTGDALDILLKSSFSNNLQRMVFSESGIFTRYTGDGKGWSAIAQIPSSICYVFGLCGPYGICRTQGDADNNMNITIDDKIGYTCTCPDGFEYVDANDWSMGCHTDYPIDCDLGSKLIKVPGLQYSATYSSPSPGWHYHYYNAPSTEDECAQLCIASCECAAATYDGEDCHLCSVGQASSGNMRSSTSVTYLKTSLYPANNSSPNNTSLQPIGNKVKGREIISTASALGIGVTLGLACIVGCANLARWYHISKSNGAHMNKEINGEGEHEHPLLEGGPGPVHFSYKELKAASNGFTNLLGRGGFGPVYKGVLAGGAIVAIKKLQGSTYGEKQFRAEVITIGSVHHINLVRLRGYCAEGPHRMLVYEFMHKGSLDKYIFHDDSTQLEGRGLLNWESRFQILLSTARAIRYLHEECHPYIVHCDIKPENILLDETLTAKVSDFGMAQLVGSEAGQTGSITRVRGTIGYMAPEWMSSKRISTKADVYSFGIVVLEVISGRRAIDTNVNSVSKMDLSTWAYSQAMEHCAALTILDPCLRLPCTSNVLPLPDAPQQATSNTSQFYRAVLVALWCIHKDPSIRPSMGLVVQVLEGLVPVDTPPYPF